MRVYIKKSEYEAIHDAWHFLNELYDGTGGDSAESISKTMDELVSIVEKYQNRPKKVKPKIDQNNCPHVFIEMVGIFKCKMCKMTLGESLHAGQLNQK